MKKPISLKFNPRIKGNDYVRIPKSNLVISRFENYKGLNYNNTLYSLSDSNKIMPSAGIFMPYLLIVKDAIQSNIRLYDANNKPIPRDEVEELDEKLSSDSWTWLNDYYMRIIEKLFYENVLNIKKDEGDFLIGLRRSPLENCVMEDCFVDLEFNKQGYPIKKSNLQNYQKGENIQFRHPRENSVARFNSYSDMTLLDCSWVHNISYPGLGVFDCAKGTPKI